MGKRLPDFTWGVEDGILWLEDLNLGGLSLTNGIEPAIESILERAKALGMRSARAVYMDSEGTWDGLVIHPGPPLSVNFVGLGEPTRSSALSKAVDGLSMQVADATGKPRAGEEGTKL